MIKVREIDKGFIRRDAQKLFNLRADTMLRVCLLEEAKQKDEAYELFKTLHFGNFKVYKRKGRIFYAKYMNHYYKFNLLCSKASIKEITEDEM